MSIRVAFVIGSFRRGGAERDLLELLRRLDRGRYEFHVFYAERDGDMLEDFEGTGVPLRPLGIGSLFSWQGLRAVRRARAYLREHVVSILVGFGVYGSFYGALIASGSPGTSLVSYEFTALEPPTLRARLFQPYYYRRSAAIVGNSDAVLAAVSRRRGVTGRRLVKIHNGVDVSLFSDDGRPETVIPGIPPGVPVVGAVGRLHSVKGHRYLVQAWPQVARRYPDARLIFVGPAWPHQQEEIERVAREAGCLDRLVLVGLRTDVPALLHGMDVVVVPSLTEGFSNVILEAGAAGRAVVATRVGGNAEAIVEGETGMLVPAKDPGAIARAVLSLLDNPEKRRRLGDAARRRVADLYTVDRMIEGYDRLFQSLPGRP